MKLRTIIRVAPWIFACASIWLAGCGSSSSTANVIAVSVIPGTQGAFPAQAISFMATVTGATTTTVHWTCTFTTTTTDSTGKTTTSKPAPCPTDGTYGTLSDPTKNVLTYTAPPLDKFPNPLPTITLTASADASPKKTGTGTVLLDSGIRLSISPLTAPVVVGLTPAQTEQFIASSPNTPPTNLAWLVTQPTAGSATNPTATPSSPSCTTTGTGNCGSIDSNGVFTAPAALPTNTSVSVVVYSTIDKKQFAVATITLLNASTNPVTFTGISPTSAPAGGVLQDIFLSAKNILNTTSISITPQGGAPIRIDPTTQVFTIPITPAYCTPSGTGSTAVTCDSSIMTRIRLTSDQLTTPGVAQITVDVPAATGSGTTPISFPLDLVNVRPGLVAAVPDSFPQNATFTFTADGGYYGSNSNQVVKMVFDGTLATSPESTFGPRQFTASIQGSQVLSPGLYPLSIVNNAQSSPPPFLTATSNVAVQPTFANENIAASAGIPMPSGSNSFPSSMVVNSNGQYVLVTEQGSSRLQVLDLSTGTPQFVAALTSKLMLPANGQPTSVAYTNTLNLLTPPLKSDTAVVVNSTDQSLSLVTISRDNNWANTAVNAKIDLKGLLPAPTTGTTPLPFSVGVDPGTNLAIVAYSNSNLGFIVTLDKNDKTHTCFPSSPVQTPPCAIASVTLSAGATPQVVMQPDAPLAYVTPGGAGVMSVVNLTQGNTSVKITSAVRTNNIVTVTTTDPNGINQSLGGTVLISNLTPTDLNGTFPVLLGSITNYSFQYFLTGANESSTSATQGTVQYGNPYYTFNTTNTTTGAAINTVTRTFGFADYNASVAQIGFIQTLDLSTTSLTLNAGGYLGNPSSAPEIGLRFVDWDPYRNLLIAFNPSTNSANPVGNEVSIINPGGPSFSGTLAQPYRIIAPIKTNGVGTGTFTPVGQGATPVTVFGAMAYDPTTKLVLLGNAGSNTLTYINLDPAAQFKPLQVKSVQVVPGGGGVPNTQPSQPGTPITTSCGSSGPYLPQSALAGCSSAVVQILGTGFKTAGNVQVRLDQNSAGITFNVLSDGEIDATIPSSYLGVPHNYALDVVITGAATTYTSNSVDFGVVGFTDLHGECAPGSSGGVEPEGIAIDDVLNLGFVTLYGCSTGSVSIINLDVNNAHGYGKPYGAVLKTLQVGSGPMGVAVIPRLGFAVVSNNSDSPGTASIIQYTDRPAFDAKVLTFTTSGSTTTSSKVTVGTAPSGVAIDQDHAYALIANSGSSTVSYIDLTVLLKSTPGTPVAVPIATDPQPKAIAVDPDRQIAVVTALETAGAGGVCGALNVITLNGTPVKNNSASICSLIATPTGIVYDPAVSPALFYATSTQSNALYAFNPSTSAVPLRVPVGINPYGVAYNYQTSTLLSVNSTSNTMSVIDSQTSKTRGTLAIGSQSQFPAAMDNINNTAVIVDQNNDRVLMIPMPH